jgi:ABC-2 type transport system permease protein
MIELSRYLKSDFYKLRHSFFFWLHILFPICGIGLMTLYAVFSTVGSLNKWIAFFQIMAIAFPFVISIVCETVAEQEARAGHCQNILILSDRPKAIISKFLILIICGFFAVMFSSLFFEQILTILYPDLELYMLAFVMPAIILWSSNIFLYAFHLILAFRYGRNICIGVGVIGSLLATLMQTDLGTGLWYVLPYGLGVRLTDFTLKSMLLTNYMIDKEVKLGFISAIIMTGILITIMTIWFSLYGGQRTDD